MRERQIDGYVLILVLTALVVLGLLSISLTFSSLGSGRAVGDERLRTQAFYTSQAGLERVTRRLKDRAQLLTPSTATFAATQLTTPATLTGDTGTGTFSVDVATESITGNTAILTLTARGKSPGDNATRILSQKVQVVLVGGGAGVYAPSSLVTTGDVKDNGAAPVAGQKYTNLPARTFTCVTPATSDTPAGTSPCKGTAGGLNTYTLETPASLTDAPKSGETYKDAAGKVYVVQRVEMNNPLAPTKATVTLASMSENPSAGSAEPMNAALVNNPSVSLSKTNTAAISTPAGSTLTNPSNNTGGVCDPAVYGCTAYGFPPSSMFQLIFGTTKEDFKARMVERGAAFTSTPTAAQCQPIMWVTVTDFTNNCTTSLASPRVIVIDARAGTSGNVQIKTDTEFHGLVYIISNTDVKMTGNGSFKGSVVSEAGVEADPKVNSDTDVGGNGIASTCPIVGAVKGNSSKPAKICYNADVISVINQNVSAALSTYTVTRLPNSWKELAQ
jgi:Tfp pilus assembly protein PilX